MLGSECSIKKSDSSLILYFCIILTQTRFVAIVRVNTVISTLLIKTICSSLNQGFKVQPARRSSGPLILVLTWTRPELCQKVIQILFTQQKKRKKRGLKFVKTFYWKETGTAPEISPCFCTLISNSLLKLKCSTGKRRF